MGFSISELMSLMEADDDKDDFSIDTSLDNDDTKDQQDGDDNADDTTGEDDTGGGDEEDLGDTGEEGGDDGGNEAKEPPEQELPEEEPNEDNTELFMTLSKEEQMMKIKILKQQYGQLYSSCDDLVQRLDNINIDESNLITINRLSESIYNLKKYLSDYLVHLFPSKSFVENDIMFNRFLDIINTITISFEKISNDIKRKENNKYTDQ